MESDGESVRVSVVEAAEKRRDRIVAALEEFEVVVESAESVGSSVADGSVDAVVCSGPAVYETVRDADPSVVVVVVAPTLDRSTLERVVADVHGDHLPPDEMLATALPVRLQQLTDMSGPAAAWRLADFTEEAVIEFDLETHALLEANDQFFDAWEWDYDQLTSARLDDLRQTDITHEIRGQGRGQSGEGELEWVRDEDPVASLVDRAVAGRYEVREWHCQTAAGDPFKSEVRVVADEANRRGYLVASVPTEGRDRSLEYDESSMLGSLLEHVPMAVYFKDEHSRHVLVSEDVVEPFIESPEGKIHHTPRDIRMKTEFDLYPSEHAEEAVADNKTVMETGQPIRDRVERVQPPHGRELFFSTTKAPWYDSDGRIQGVVGVTTDITDRKHRERALDRQREHAADVAELLGNLADRLADIESRVGANAADVVSETGALAAAVRAFARAGAPVADTEWLAGHAEAAARWDALEPPRATLETDWSYAIRADQDRLETLFDHLFGNAVEHAGPDVTVEVGTLSEEPGFYVADDGPGVPEALREDLFEPGTADDGGTGYGLAIVREVAEAHGWDVGYVDADDGGARIEITHVPRGE